MTSIDQVEDDWRLVQKLGEGLTFTFTKGPLIQAMERGDWILLDNINCARGDVIERLNSLAEAEPTLNLYESSDGHQYKRGNGIHPNFRLFVIGNTNRKGSQKLSNAWRNRCLIVRMQRLDDQLKIDNVEEHDAAELLKGELQGINAGQEFAHTLLRLHASAQQLFHEKRIELITSYTYSYRNLKRAARILRTFASRGEDLINGLRTAIFRSYVDPIVNRTDHDALVQCFVEHLSNDELEKTTFATLPMLKSSATGEKRDQDMEWYRTAQRLRDLLAAIEESTYDFHLQMINKDFSVELLAHEQFRIYASSLLDHLQPFIQLKATVSGAQTLLEIMPTIEGLQNSCKQNSEFKPTQNIAMYLLGHNNR